MGVGRVVLVGGNRLALGNLGHYGFRSVLVGGVHHSLHSLNRVHIGGTRSTVCVRPRASNFSFRRTLSHIGHVFNVTNFDHTYIYRGAVSSVVGGSPRCLGGSLVDVGAFGIRTGHTSGHFPLASPRVYHRVNNILLSTCPRLSISIRGPSLIMGIRVHSCGTCMHNRRVGNTNNLPINATNGTSVLVSNNVSDPITT